MSHSRQPYPPSVNGARGHRRTDLIGGHPDTRRAVLDEANALLASAGLHGDDARWLRGALVDVMISPVGGDGEQIIVLTVVPRRPGGTGLAGARVRLTDSDGVMQESGLDGQGQARLSLAAGSYELAVETPQPAPPELASPTSRLSPRRTPDGRRRGPRRSSGSRPRRWTVGATVAALFLGAVPALVVLGGGTPAVATVDLYRAGCEATRGTSSPRHVVVAATWAGEEQKRFRQVLERFESASGIDVTFATNLSHSNRDLPRTLYDFIDKGCPPDVALLPQPALLKQLANEGHALPLDDVAGDLIRRNYTEEWQEVARGAEKKSYGVWFKGADKSIIWYDVEAFKRVGIERPPATWEEFKAVAAQLHQAGITPLAVGGKDGWTLTDWFENVYLRMWGRDRYNELTRHTIRWTHQTVKDALAKLGEIFGTSHWMAGGTSGALNTSYEESVLGVFGAPLGPQAAMVFEGGFVANLIAGTDAKVGTDAKYFDFPSIEVRDRSSAAPEARARAQISGGAAVGGDVAALLNNTPAARKLIRFLATPRAVEPWVRQGGFISPNTKVSLDDYPKDGLTRRSAESLLGRHGDVLFDLSDLQPPAFGATKGQGMWAILREFLANPEAVDDVTTQLEEARVAAGPGG